jgi:hypothetical protein
MSKRPRTRQELHETNNHLLADDHKRICAGLQRRAHATAAFPHHRPRCACRGYGGGYEPAEDKRHYHVTPSGLTVVTRDHSPYESHVDSDYLNGPR